MQEVFNFTRGESAIICVLLLRGAQTPGELRGRGERMHRFEDLDEVQSALQRLMQREPPLAKVLPRQPGTKESRYMHLLSGEPENIETLSAAAILPRAVGHDRVAALEEEVNQLRKDVDDLKQQFAGFRKQFE